MNIVMWLSNFDGKIPIPAVLKPKQLWTGKQIFSLILSNVNLVRYSNGHPDDEKGPPNEFISPTDTKVVIEQGELLCGIVDKRTVGNSQGSLIHITQMEHGHEATRNFLDQCQKIVNYFLLNHGFTVGIGDTIADDQTMDKVFKVLSKTLSSLTSPDYYFRQEPSEGAYYASPTKPIRMYSWSHRPRILRKYG